MIYAYRMNIKKNPLQSVSLSAVQFYYRAISFHPLQEVAVCQSSNCFSCLLSLSMPFPVALQCHVSSNVWVFQLILLTESIYSTIIRQKTRVTDTVNTSLTKWTKLGYLPCIKYFGLPIAVICPVNRNINEEECFLLVSVSKGCTSLL